MLELHQVAQRAHDLDRAVDFYTKVLGGVLIARFDPPGLAFLTLSSSRLLLEQSAPSARLCTSAASTSCKLLKSKALFCRSECVDRYAPLL